MSEGPTPFEVHESGAYFHGTKADLSVGDLLVPGRRSNFGGGRSAGHVYVYVCVTLDAASWGGRARPGRGPGADLRRRAHRPREDDPNGTDKEFPGSPTRSYRSKAPVRIVGEIEGWVGHPPEQVQTLRDRVADLARLGLEDIDD